MARPVLRVGVDEAGYAPRLGPLVVTCVRLERPADAPDLYECLAPVVSRRPPRRTRTGEGPAPLFVADSKKVHASSKGVSALERGALPFLSVALGDNRGGGLTDLALAHALTRGSLDRSGLDWYGGPPERLPVAADADDVARSTEALARALDAAGVRGLAVRSRIVTARELNATIARGLNKAELLVEVVAGLLAPLGGDLAARPDGPTREGQDESPREAAVLVDRLGGRRDYLPLLDAAFPDAWARELSRGARESSYSVEGPASRWRCGVAFACEAESSCMTVALASMVSKYARELFMARLNRWFAARVTGVRPTAGYPVDGERFLRETADFRSRSGVADGDLVRSR